MMSLFWDGAGWCTEGGGSAGAADSANRRMRLQVAENLFAFSINVEGLSISLEDLCSKFGFSSRNSECGKQRR